MNWTEVSVVGAASAFPMSGRGMGGGRAGAENSRPLPGTIHPASGGDCRTSPLVLGPNSPLCEAPEGRDLSSAALLTFRSRSPPFVCALPWGPSPDV